MLRKTTNDYRMITDGWVSIDPADEAIIEGVYKKNLREGEERLMLAVCALIALLAGYEQTARSIEKVAHRVEAETAYPW